MHKVLEPPGWAKPIGYANGISARGRQVFIAGQVGWDADQKFRSLDIADQFEQALRNILTVLALDGGRAEHICRMTCYCTDKDGYMAARRRIGAAWKILIDRHFPVMTMVFVVALVDEGAKVELEATAVIPD